MQLVFAPHVPHSSHREKRPHSLLSITTFEKTGTARSISGTTSEFSEDCFRRVNTKLESTQSQNIFRLCIISSVTEMSMAKTLLAVSAFFFYFFTMTNKILTNAVS